MKMLEDRIRKDGIVREGNVLKVDSFINHQMDIPLFREMAREWKRLFAGKPINKVLTIEASGIGIAAVPAMSMPAGEHSVLRAVPLTDPVVTRTVGLIRLSGRIQSYVAAELEKLIIEQYPSG